MAGDEDKPMNLEDDLLRKCARGDSAAYRELVERLEKPLVNFILRFVGERHVAEDLFQETFVRVVKTLGSFRPEASLSTWIFTIARNLSLDWLKAKRRHREMALDAVTSEEKGRVIYFKDVMRSSSASPDDRAESTEDERRVTAALARLSPIKREALVLRIYAGLQYSEIARIQGAPVGTVKFRIHEAVRDLTKLMGVEDDRNSTALGG
ncbi:MAG: sigma-70 family RNA polymerase sigma factor [Planctomycetota bacterium]|nr:MAG: sigma-70 family RNA polymerase sigma factor [Planctomycetota bacterium]